MKSREEIEALAMQAYKDEMAAFDAAPKRVTIDRELYAEMLLALGILDHRERKQKWKALEDQLFANMDATEF